MNLPLTNTGLGKNQDADRARSNHLFGGIAGLSPAYFALVMATGIVSVAAQLHASFIGINYGNKFYGHKRSMMFFSI